MADLDLTGRAAHSRLDELEMALLHAGNRRTSMMRRLEYLEERVDALQRRVADAEDRAESLRQDRVESLRRVARYTAAPANYPPGYPYPFGGTTDEED